MTVPSSTRAKGAALALSVMALGGGLVVSVQSAPVEIAGGGTAAPSQLGSSFADLAAGTEVADPTDNVQAADPVEPAEPDKTAEPIEPTPPEPMAEDQPVEPAPSQPADPTPPDPAQPAEVTPPQTETTALTPTPMVQTADSTLPAMPDVTPAETPQPAEPPEPAEPAEVAQPPETEMITGEALPPGVVVSSQRPPTRTDAFEAKHRRPDPPPQPAPEPEPQRQPTRQAQRQPTATQGNSDRSERAGSQQDTGGAASGATGQRQASQAGNAAASNYPGQVMSRLSRVPRPSVRAAGSAVVSFSVAGSGGLASVGIARSSGSGALDRAAVQLVRRAAPFPAPPPGAQRSFSITIAGR